jgi:hypothetical protein
MTRFFGLHIWYREYPSVIRVSCVLSKGEDIHNFIFPKAPGLLRTCAEECCCALLCARCYFGKETKIFKTWMLEVGYSSEHV